MSGSNHRKQSFCAIESLETRRLLAFTYAVTDEGVATVISADYSQAGITRVNDSFLSGTHQVPLKTGRSQAFGYYVSPKGKAVNLPPLAGASFNGSDVTDMSETGVAVGSSRSATGLDEATAWAGGAPIDLGQGDLTAISSDGKFIAGNVPFRAGPSNLTTHAAIYGGKKPIDLGDLGTDGHFSRAYGVNNAGIVVGDSAINTAGLTPFYYDTAKKKIVRIGANNQLDGSAYAINDSNVVVGVLKGKPFSFDVNSKTLKMYNAPAITGTLSTSVALDINNAGEFVGFTGNTQGTSVATLWEGGIPIDLNKLIPAGTGIKLQFAKSINDKGQIIAVGSTATSFGETFLLSPNRAILSSKGTLTIQGSIAADAVDVGVKGSKIKLSVNGVGQTFVKSSVKRLAISLLAGNDSLTLATGLPAAHVSAGAGKDVLFVRDGKNDVIDGGAGTDKAQVDAGDSLTLVESLIA